MSWLNYTHLRCLWATVREGSVSAASRALHVSQPTVSAHLKSLEQAVGEPLLERSRGGVSLTDRGRIVYRYAEEIFRLSAELEGAARGNQTMMAPRLRIGVADVVPKVVAHRVLTPALGVANAPQLVCYEGKPPELLLRLARGDLDAVIADVPVDPQIPVDAFNHLLGETTLSILGPPALADAAKGAFPEALDGAPFLLPVRSSVLRRELDRWFGAQGVHPMIRGEFEDFALLKVFASDGLGYFGVPTVIEDEAIATCGAEVVARVEDVRERFYLITLERRVRHAALEAVVHAARNTLFT